MLLHQGIGLEAFNGLPTRRCVHALYECCNSVAMAAELARGRPYPDRAALFTRAEAALFALSEKSVDEIMQAYPSVGRRPSSAWSHAERCSVWDPETERTVVRNEIAKLNRSRLERMLGPAQGYDNWA